MITLRKSHLLLLAGTLALSQTGCKDLLDLKPLDVITDASYWKTPNDFMLAANTFYSYERTFSQVVYDVVPNSNPAAQNYHADFKGDLVASQNIYSRGLNTLLTVDPNYTTAYSRIRTINYLLDRAQTYPSPTEIKKYVAEAKFFRAYVYFDLLQTYGGVQIVNKLLALDAPELQAPQNTRDEVTDFIIQDLEAAIVDLPAKAAQDVATEQGRINIETAQAFLGRVALYEGTWQKYRGNTGRGNLLLDKAVTNSNAVITGARYQLFAPAALGDSAQKYMFILENQKSNPANITKTSNNEYILANRYDQTIRRINNNVSRSAAVGLTRTFANLYLCQDGLPVDKSPLFRGYAALTSEFFARDNRMRYNMKKPNNIYWYSGGNGRVNWTGDATDRGAGAPYVVTTTISGYTSQKWVGERTFPDNEEGYDYPVIRYAEVLLNYAEAVYERNSAISDADLDRSLNLVRNRVNRTMPKLSNSLVGANALNMRDEIRRERTIELYMEGFRVDDLKRWNIAQTELRKPMVGIKWTGTAYTTAWLAQASTPKDAEGAIIVDAAGNRQYTGSKNDLQPIPTTQIQLNPQLQQNPGW